jgi:hypothetical protein
MDEYNNDGHANRKFGARKPRYEKGSLLQRIFDPLAGAPKNEFGTVCYSISAADL